MALSVRRKLPLVLGPLILGYGFHAARQQLISNDAPPSAGGNGSGGSGGVSGSHIFLLNPAQVSARLRQNEESVEFERGTGILRYDFAQVSSNSPCEDDHSERIVSVPLVSANDVESNTDWHFYGIYDGHGGFSTSQKLREALIPRVVGQLNQIYQPVVPGSSRRLVPVDPDAIDDAIKNAFVSLDDEIVQSNIARLLSSPSRKAAVELLPPALSGSCALLAFYDSSSRDLRVAITGDSRAVLGVRRRSGHWQAKALTEDQTGSNEDEVRRIRSEHPQSENDSCVRHGRVLGIYEPTRSFGDGAVKWSREIQRKLATLFFGTRMSSALLTPPYMTAKPVITRTQLQVDEEPGFVVLASDGLFEMLSNDQVVGLVVDWLQQRQPASLDVITNPKGKPVQGSTVRGADRMGRLASFFFRSKPRRQVGDPVEDVTDHKENLKAPIYRRSSVESKSGSGNSGSDSTSALQAGSKSGGNAAASSSAAGTADTSGGGEHITGSPQWASAQDANAATHLIRSALGGNDQEQVSLLLSIPAPMSRNYRDDLTVTVVFFGSQTGGDGSVRKSKL